MSSDGALRFDAYIQVESVTIFAMPITAQVAFVAQGSTPRQMALALVNPRPVEVCARFVDSELYAIRILDQNVEDGGWREFGRFRIELWDEDCVFAGLEADQFAINETEE